MPVASAQKGALPAFTGVSALPVRQAHISVLGLMRRHSNRWRQHCRSSTACLARRSLTQRTWARGEGNEGRGPPILSTKTDICSFHPA